MRNDGVRADRRLAAAKPRKVVAAALGVLLLILVLLYALGFRSSPSSGPAMSLATILFAVSTLLWITQSLSSAVSRRLDDALRRLFPWTNALCLVLVGAAAVALALLGLVAPIYSLIHGLPVPSPPPSPPKAGARHGRTLRRQRTLGRVDIADNSSLPDRRRSSSHNLAEDT